jgi:predicted transposase YbfD/YdcC
LADAFAAVPDPRSPRGRWHPLVAILLIAACATTCDADGVTAIWQWVDDADERVLARLRVRRDPWSGRRVPPSERTIQRVLARLARLDPQTVQDAAGAFLAGRLAAAGLVRPPPVREREQRRAQGRDRCRPRRRPRPRGVGFDGKVLRGARRPSGKRVGLLAGAEHGSGAVIAQRVIDTKSNEIPELRTLVAGMDLAGTVATADAAHCQRATAEAIVAACGHYLLILKANQVQLLKAVALLLSGPKQQWAGGRHDSTNRGHGRTEHRLVRIAAADGIEFPHAAQVIRTVRYSGGWTGNAPASRSSTASPASPARTPTLPRWPPTSVDTGASRTGPLRA